MLKTFFMIIAIFAPLFIIYALISVYTVKKRQFSKDKDCIAPVDTACTSCGNHGCPMHK